MTHVKSDISPKLAEATEYVQGRLRKSAHLLDTCGASIERIRQEAWKNRVNAETAAPALGVVSPDDLQGMYERALTKGALTVEDFRELQEPNWLSGWLGGDERHADFDQAVEFFDTQVRKLDSAIFSSSMRIRSAVQNDQLPDEYFQPATNESHNSRGRTWGLFNAQAPPDVSLGLLSPHAHALPTASSMSGSTVAGFLGPRVPQHLSRLAKHGDSDLSSTSRSSLALDII